MYAFGSAINEALGICRRQGQPSQTQSPRVEAEARCRTGREPILLHPADHKPHPRTLPTDVEYIRMANFIYDKHAPKFIQAFPARKEIHEFMNSGSASALWFTCLYRLRVCRTPRARRHLCKCWMWSLRLIVPSSHAPCHLELIPSSHRPLRKQSRISTLTCIHTLTTIIISPFARRIQYYMSVFFNSLTFVTALRSSFSS